VARGLRAEDRAEGLARERELIESENRYQATHDDSVLPQGIIHGDYFHDNVLWDGDGHPGVIDFYFACDDVLVYDLAIAANDWCVDVDATMDAARVAALIEGYEQRQPLEARERELWPVMLRRAALRTWLGRLGYNHFPLDSHMTIEKDHGFLAAPARAPHRARASARLMDTTIRVAEVPAGRGAGWLADAFGLFRRKPMAWIALTAGWLVVTFGLLIVPFIGGVIANFLQPVFFASFAIAALRQIGRRADRDGRPLPRVPAQPARAGEPGRDPARSPRSRSSPAWRCSGCRCRARARSRSPSPNTSRC
jgi:hypothetical protein